MECGEWLVTLRVVALYIQLQRVGQLLLLGQLRLVGPVDVFHDRRLQLAHIQLRDGLVVASLEDNQFGFRQLVVLGHSLAGCLDLFFRHFFP